MGIEPHNAIRRRPLAVLTRVGRNETAEVDIAAKADIPNDSFTQRIAGV